MIGENRQLVTDEPVEIQHYRRITDHFLRIYRIYPNLIKENWRMPTVTGWTWIHQDLNRLCPEISPITGAYVLVTDKTKSFVLNGLHLNRQSSDSSHTAPTLSTLFSLILGPPHGHPMTISVDLHCSSKSGLHRSCINHMLSHHCLFLFPNITHATKLCAPTV
jgi:hypothetical protein